MTGSPIFMFPWLISMRKKRPAWEGLEEDLSSRDR
jgi:hypothetical protein